MLYKKNTKHSGEIMKKLFLLLFLFLFTINCHGQSPEDLAKDNAVVDTNKVLAPDDVHPKINQIITKILTGYHYSQPQLQDSLSAVIFKNYIESLDRNKLYFTQADIDTFETYKFNFDEYLATGTSGAAFEIFNTFKKRLNQRMEYVFFRIDNYFDFKMDEEYKPHREEEQWARSRAELDEIWRKKLKNEALSLVLNGKDEEGVKETLSKRYKRYHKIILQYKPEDVFQVYLNAFAGAVDPHTNYFSPITSENFKIGMSLSLEGIGAQLTTRDDMTTVNKIIPGGPADKSELLFPDDRIVGVAQGDEGEIIDVIGWRLDDVVQLIRGKKGTKVRLEILRAADTPGMQTEMITLIRDKVKLEEEAAKKEIITFQQEGILFKFGVIDLPSFYVDFEAKNRGDKDFKSTTRDVKKIIEELKDANVDGIIIDLRNNGGGSLQEVIELTGLFIENGPVVQVRNTDSVVEVGRDPDPQIVYDGPLAVLVNRYSASASEIFAGAIQDYGRGLIIGEQTYGKGTVQNLIDLNRFMPSKDRKLGQLKLTIAKYYRISGSSTQKLGVVPDVSFPSMLAPEEYGESAFESALKWDRIEATNYKKYNDFESILPKLINNYEERIKTNLEFQYLLEDIEEYRVKKEKTHYSLNLAKREEEQAEQELKNKMREDERERNTKVQVVEKEEVDGPKLRVDDAFLEESGRILADLIMMTIG